MQRYFGLVLEQIEKIRSTQWQALRLGAQWLGETLRKDRWLFAFGTGHSHMVAEEIFYRAGGLARANPILDSKLMLHDNAIEATYLERKEGYAKELLAQYPCGEGDLLVVASNSGRNAVPIEVALEGRDKGMKVIVITNLQHIAVWGSRHSSGRTLADVGDLVLDSCAVEGDAALPMEGLPGKIGPTSSITSLLLLNLLIVQGIENAVKNGYTPEIYISSNANGDNHNEVMLQKYKSRIRHL